jgi:hypothetical protein
MALGGVRLTGIDCRLPEVDQNDRLQGVDPLNDLFNGVIRVKSHVNSHPCIKWRGFFLDDSRQFGFRVI